MSLLASVQIGCLAALSLLLLVAAWQDLRTLHIADAIPLAITGIFLGWAFTGWARGSVTPTEFGLALAGAFVILFVAALAFAAHAMGGGDVKLLAAVSLFAGPTDLMLDFLLVTALSGGLLALAILAGLPIGPKSSPRATTLRTRLHGRVAYGPAIAAGGLWIAAARAFG